MVKKVRYQEEEIRDLRGNRFYLRSKWSVSEYVVVTIRTLQRYIHTPASHLDRRANPYVSRSERKRSHDP